MKHDLLDPPATATLVVRYGNTPHRERPLAGDLVVVGRGRGCDLTLSGPDIAEVHCILVSGLTGWRIRDCGSRTGTRVNGQVVQDAPLADGDLLHVGAFLFEVRLPPEEAGRRLLDPEEERHLRRSRRRLARTALRLRSRLQEQQDRAAEMERRAEEMNQLADELRTRLRSCDQHTARLQQTGRDLAQERELLEKERAELRAQAAQLEEEKERHRQATATPPPPPQTDSGEAARRLDIRRRELDCYARHLRVRSQSLEARRVRLKQARATLRRVSAELGADLEGGEATAGRAGILPAGDAAAADGPEPPAGAR
jgi:DNA repair exonuclease SbcCD ATPase subunit